MWLSAALYSNVSSTRSCVTIMQEFPGVRRAYDVRIDIKKLSLYRWMYIAPYMASDSNMRIIIIRQYICYIYNILSSPYEKLDGGNRDGVWRACVENPIRGLGVAAYVRFVRTVWLQRHL